MPRIIRAEDIAEELPAAPTRGRVVPADDVAEELAVQHEPDQMGAFLHRSGIGGAAKLVKDYFTDERRPGDAPVSGGRAMGLAAQQTLGGDDGEIARDDPPQPTSFGGEGARYLPQIPPPADGRERAVIDTARADEIRRASDQHPFLYRATQGALTGADLAAGAAEDLVRGGANALNRYARREGGRVAGYTPALVKSQGPEAAEAAIERALDERIITRSNTPAQMQATTEASRTALGNQLSSVRAELDAMGERVKLNDLVARFDTIDLGQRGTRGEVALRAELERIVDDAAKYADANGDITTSALANLKDQLAKVYRRYGEGGVPDLEGIGGLTRDAHGQTLAAENELFERAAPSAIADKARYGDLANLDEALTNARARDVIAPRSVGGKTLTDRVVGVIDKVYGGAQGRAVDARTVARIAESRFAPVLEAIEKTGGVPRLTATLQALQSNPEFQALVYGASTDEPATEASAPPPGSLAGGQSNGATDWSARLHEQAAEPDDAAEVARLLEAGAKSGEQGIAEAALVLRAKYPYLKREIAEGAKLMGGGQESLR